MHFWFPRSFPTKRGLQMPARCCFFLWERHMPSPTFLNLAGWSNDRSGVPFLFFFLYSFIHSININLTTTISKTVVTVYTYICIFVCIYNIVSCFSDSQFQIRSKASQRLWEKDWLMFQTEVQILMQEPEVGSGKLYTWASRGNSKKY